MNEETKLIKAESENPQWKIVLRIVDYIFLFVAIRMVAVYFGNVEHGMFWILTPVLIPAAVIALVVIASIEGEKMVKCFKRKKGK